MAAPIEKPPRKIRFAGVPAATSSRITWLTRRCMLRMPRSSSRLVKSSLKTSYQAVVSHPRWAVSANFGACGNTKRAAGAPKSATSRANGSKSLTVVPMPWSHTTVHCGEEPSTGSFTKQRRGAGPAGWRRSLKSGTPRCTERRAMASGLMCGRSSCAEAVLGGSGTVGAAAGFSSGEVGVSTGAAAAGSGAGAGVSLALGRNALMTVSSVSIKGPPIRSRQ